jgi:6-phosphofructokinase 1
MSNSSRDTTILTTLVVVSASMASTYVLTTYLHDLKDTKKRLEKYKERVTLRETCLAAQKANKEPSGKLLDDIKIDKVFLWEVENLGSRFAPEMENVENTMKTGGARRVSFVSALGLRGPAEPVKSNAYNKLISNHECILADLVRRPGQGSTHTRAYVRAGPRKHLHFDPANVNAAIVTCGGLCPGLNNVVREITKTLRQTYFIGGKVYGIRGGFRGFYDPNLPPLELTPELVEDIHHEGGTLLGSSRGGFDLEKIIAFIKAREITQLFVIGGDGTHRGAFSIYEGCMAQVSVCVNNTIFLCRSNLTIFSLGY